MARYRNPRNRVYVWAAPCPKCEVGKDTPCRDLRSQTGTLFGRRTHAERRAAVRAMGNPKVNPTRSRIRRVPATTIQWTQAANAINLATTQYATAMTNFTTALTTTTATINTTINTTGWTVTRDEIWAGWTVGNTTTGTYARITDADLHRFDGTGITWNTIQPYPDPRHEQVYRQWVEHDQRRDQRRADEEQRRAEALNRQRLWEQQAQRAAEEKIAAHARALELLHMLLTDDQLAEWHRDHRITVRGSEGGRYRIEGHRDTVHGNIVQIDEHGCPLARLCVSSGMYDTEGALPTPDGWVGQLLAIRHNELELVAKANFSHHGRCQNPDVPVLGAA